MTWSFSALDNFETCPKKYEAYSVSRSVKDDSTENIDWGNLVHDNMKQAILSGSKLPEDLAPWQKWVDRVRSGPGELMVEQKYALTADLSPCGYRAPTAWYRGIADVVRILDTVGLAIDWKTGNVKDNPTQLGLMALCLFQHYAALRVVRTEFVWLKEDDTTQRIYRREDMAGFVAELLPRVHRLDHAHKTNTFPPKPSGLCVKYCKVVSCPYHGVGNRGTK